MLGYDWCEVHTLMRQPDWCEIHTLMWQSDWCEIHTTLYAFKKKKKKKPGKGCSPPLQQWIWELVHCRWHEQRGLVKSIPARFARDLWMINWRKVEVYHTSVLRKRLHWIVPVRRLSSSLDFFQTSDNLLPLNFLYNLSWFTWDAMDLFRHCLNAV